MSRATWILLFLAGVLGGALFQVKYKVIGYENELAVLNEKTANDRESIKVLHAEWTYLCGPQRLQQLSNQFLALRPIQPQQLVALNELARVMQEEEVLLTVNSQADKIESDLKNNVHEEKHNSAPLSNPLARKVGT